MLPRLLASVAVCATLAAAPAFADRGYKKHHGHGGHHREYRTVVYHQPVYRVAPRAVYVQPAYYYDGPRYVEHRHHHGCGHDNDAWKWIGGGMLVGAILHDVYD